MIEKSTCSSVCDNIVSITKSFSIFLLPFSSIYTEILPQRFDPITLRTAKTQWSFGSFECNRVKQYLFHVMSQQIKSHEIHTQYNEWDTEESQ